MLKTRNFIFTKIGFIYILITAIHLASLGYYILGKQDKLTSKYFEVHSEAMAKHFMGNDLASAFTIAMKQEQAEVRVHSTQLRKLLLNYNSNWFLVFNQQGKRIYKEQGFLLSDAKEKSIEKNIQSQISALEKYPQSQINYTKQLDSDDFSMELFSRISLASIHKADMRPLYLLVSFNLDDMQAIGKDLRQEAIGVLALVLFLHILLWLLLSKFLFRRLRLLAQVNKGLTQGNLTTQIQRRPGKYSKDILSILDHSFDTIAQSMREKTQDILSLKAKLQQEHSISNRVQNLLLHNSKNAFTDLKPHLYTRPLDELSGDLCYYLKFTNGQRGIFFADSPKQGITATMLTYFSIEGILHTPIHKQNLFNKLNELVCRRSQQAFHLSATFILLDQNNGVWIINAGNYPCYILHEAQNTRTTIHSCSLALGVSPETNYILKHYPAKKGDKIFLYTDGLVNTKNEKGEVYSTERLTYILDENIKSPIEEISTKLQQDLSSFARSYTDDFSFMVLELP